MFLFGEMVANGNSYSPGRNKINIKTRLFFFFVQCVCLTDAESLQSAASPSHHGLLAHERIAFQ